MHKLLRRLRSERGFSLILAIGTSIVLGMSVTSLILYTTANERTSRASASRVSARALAEAGLNNAMSIINATDTPLWTSLLATTTKTLEGGTATWSGTLDDSQPNTNCPGHLACWLITSTGKIAYSPVGAANKSQTLTAKVPIDPVYAQNLVNDVYDYVFVYGTGDPSGCDFQNSNNTTFDSPLYVQGNLCIGNSTSITNELHVWGHAAVVSPASIGQKNGALITYDLGGCNLVPARASCGVHIKQGCGTSNSGPFSTSTCGPTQRIWALPAVDTTTKSLTPPDVTASAQGWYKTASPGPYSPCKTSTGTPSNTGNWATAFDNDQGSTPDSSKMNRSVGGAFNLTPGSAYSCKTTWGELSYDPAPKDALGVTQPPLLTVKGTVFIDGNGRIAPSNKPLIRVAGVGTIYFSGSFVLTGTNVCAAYISTSCNFAKPSAATWDVSQNFLGIVAGVVGGGGQSETTDSSTSISLSSASFQGELTAANKTEVTQQTSTQGPLVQKSMVLANALRTYEFGTLSEVPTATPDNSIKTVKVLAPIDFGG